MSRPVSIVVVARSALSQVRSCLGHLAESISDAEVIVVGNAPSEEAQRYLTQLESSDRRFKLLLSRRKRSYATACNLGVAQARHGMICLLASDVSASGDWLEPLVSCLDRGVGAVGAKLVNDDRTLYHCGVEFLHGQEPRPHYLPQYRFANYPEEIVEANRLESVPAVSGSCLLTTKIAWTRASGLDEVFVPADFSHADLCLGFRLLGLDVLYQPASRLVTTGESYAEDYGSTVDEKSRVFDHSIERFNEKWFDRLSDGLGRVS